MTANDIHLDDQLASLLPQPTDAELFALRESLRAEGLREPLWVWPHEGRRVLIDGYTRLKLARQLGVEIRCKEVGLADRNAALAYRMVIHLERRSLSMLAQAVLRGRLHLLVGGRQGERTDLPGHEAGALLTAAGIAARFSVSERTIRRDRRLAEAVNRLGADGQQGPQFVALLMAGRTNLTRRGILQLTHMGRVEQQRVLARLERERKDRQTRPRRKPAAPKAATTDRNDRNFGASTPPVTRPTGPTATGGPSIGGWSKASNTASVGERRQACPTPAGAAVARGTIDDNLLERLTDLFKQADHATRLAFLGQPVVRIAIGRLNTSEARK